MFLHDKRFSSFLLICWRAHKFSSAGDCRRKQKFPFFQKKKKKVFKISVSFFDMKQCKIRQDDKIDTLKP